MSNNDPAKIPVHPRCNCEVVTHNVETGLDDLGSRADAVVGQANLATATELSLRELRFGDVLRWLEQVTEQSSEDDFLTFITDEDTVTMLVQRVAEAVGARQHVTVQSGAFRVLTIPIAEADTEALARVYRALIESEVTDGNSESQPAD